MANNPTRKFADWFSSNTRLALLLGFVSFLLYANTLWNGYVLDDATVITKNTIVTKGFAGIPEILVTPRMKGFVQSNDAESYRPVPLILSAIEYGIWGAYPAENHFSNILLFCGCVIALFLFLNLLFSNTVVSFITALLFALHPVHTEVVANIKSRDELLCFLFGFLALKAFTGYAGSGRLRQLATGSLFLLLSFLSKETVIAFLVVIPLIFFFYINENRKRSIAISGAAIAVTAVFLLLRAGVLGAHHTATIEFTANPLLHATFADRIATAVMVLGIYLKLLFVPWPLICDYGYSTIATVGMGNIFVLLSFAVLLISGVIAVYRLLKKNKDPLAFGILFFFSTIAVFSNIPLLIYSELAERFLFFPSVGFCLSLALLIKKLTIKPADAAVPLLENRTLLLVMIPVSFAYCSMTFNRNSDWYDNYTLYKTDLKKAPDNCRLLYYYGTELVNLARLDERDDSVASNRKREQGLACLKRSLAIYPNFHEVCIVLGNSFFTSRLYDSAGVYYFRAIEINPSDTFSINKLAGVYFKKAEYARSIEFCIKAIGVDSGYSRGYRNIGICYLKMGKYDSSIAPLKQAMRLDDNTSPSFGYLAIAYNHLQIPDSTRKYDSIAKAINPGFILQ
jgi:protein O-mannosyl-transferase